MTVRRYQPGEEQAVWTVYFRATHESNGRDYHPDLLNRWAPPDQDMSEWSKRLARQKPFVAVVEGLVVGMAEIEDDGGIGHFYVCPDHQGRGIGSRLLEKLESEACGMGFDEIFADVSVTANPFFEARGFRIIEARSNVIIGHPAPNFRMAKPLKGDKVDANKSLQDP